MPAKKFDVGNKVRCIQNAAYQAILKIGEIYTVSKWIDQPCGGAYLQEVSMKDTPTLSGFDASRFELVANASAAASNVYTGGAKQRDLTGTFMHNMDGDVFEVVRNDPHAAPGSDRWELTCTSPNPNINSSWKVGDMAIESGAKIIANEIPKADIQQWLVQHHGPAATLHGHMSGRVSCSQEQPMSIPKSELPEAVCHCSCGKAKVWYQPFRGERELVCPVCPKGNKNVC